MRPRHASAVRRWLAVPGSETGAAAVEMALVLPLLLFVLFGIIDFGRAFNTQIQLSQAAREGARLVAMQSPTSLTSRVDQAAPGLDPAAMTVAVSYLDTSTIPPTPVSDCSGGSKVNAQVTVTVPFTWITGISGMAGLFGSGTFPTPTNESAVGVMQCSAPN
jgi:Flp pilus assembly protein TadG